MTAQRTTEEYPHTASVLAVIGGCFMILAGLLILGVSVFVIPHLSSSFFNSTSFFNNTRFFNHGTGPMSIHDLPGFVGGILTAVGLSGLISGLIVLGSGVMLRTNPRHSVVFGVLMLVFSVLSFFGTGGFVIGAILGIIGGILTLSWRRPVVVPTVPSGSVSQP
jgi:hypothetical protein